MTTTLMYWLVILDNFSCLFGTLIALAIGWIIMNTVRCINASIENEPPPLHAWSHIFRGLGFIGVVAAIATFVPSTKQMAAIIVVPKIVNNEAVQAAGNELYTLALDWMKELRPKKEKEKKEKKCTHL